MKRFLLLTVILLFMLGCATRGTYTYKKRIQSGSTTRTTSVLVESPSAPISPATFKGNPTGEHTVSTGNQQKQDFVMQGVASIATWGGIGLILLGLIGLGAATYFPWMKFRYGIYSMIAGGALIALPIFLDRYTWILALLLVGWLLAEYGPSIYEDYQKEIEES